MYNIHMCILYTHRDRQTDRSIDMNIYALTGHFIMYTCSILTPVWTLFKDFECVMVVSVRRAGPSISTADLQGFSHTTISRVYREWSKKEKISSERQLCGRKCLDVRGQRRMGRLVRDDRKATVSQITTRYNQGIQNTISEHTTHRTLK